MDKNESNSSLSPQPKNSILSIRGNYKHGPHHFECAAHTTGAGAEYPFLIENKMGKISGKIELKIGKSGRNQENKNKTRKEWNKFRKKHW